MIMDDDSKFEEYFSKDLEENVKETYVYRNNKVYILSDEEISRASFLRYEKTLECEIETDWFNQWHYFTLLLEKEILNNSLEYDGYFVFEIMERDYDYDKEVVQFKLDAYGVEFFDVEEFEERNELKELIEEDHPNYFRQQIEAYKIRDEIYQEWENDNDGIGLRYWWYLNREKFEDDNSC